VPFHPLSVDSDHPRDRDALALIARFQSLSADQINPNSAEFQFYRQYVLELNEKHRLLDELDFQNVRKEFQEEFAIDDISRSSEQSIILPPLSRARNRVLLSKGKGKVGSSNSIGISNNNCASNNISVGRGNANGNINISSTNGEKKTSTTAEPMRKNSTSSSGSTCNTSSNSASNSSTINTVKTRTSYRSGGV
jgi:hypothetical protein